AITQFGRTSFGRDKTGRRGAGGGVSFVSWRIGVAGVYLGVLAVATAAVRRRWNGTDRPSARSVPLAAAIGQGYDSVDRHFRPVFHMGRMVWISDLSAQGASYGGLDEAAGNNLDFGNAGKALFGPGGFGCAKGRSGFAALRNASRRGLD